MKKQNIKDEIRLIVAEQFDMSPELIDGDTDINDLGADSLDRMEIAYELERRFDIDFPEEADNCRTVGDYVERVREILREK